MALGDACAMDHKDRILIVDDDPDIRQLLVDYLARNGFDALPAGSPAARWRRCSSTTPSTWWCWT
jgi:DNA-binding response OmpR family regulator